MNTNAARQVRQFYYELVYDQLHYQPKTPTFYILNEQDHKTFTTKITQEAAREAARHALHTPTNLERS